MQPHVADGAEGSARPSKASAANGAAHAGGGLAGAPVVSTKAPGPDHPDGAAVMQPFAGTQSLSSQSTCPSQSSSMPLVQFSVPHPPPDEEPEPDDEPDEDPDDEPEEDPDEEPDDEPDDEPEEDRSEEHTSELQSLV